MGRSKAILTPEFSRQLQVLYGHGSLTLDFIGKVVGVSEAAALRYLRNLGLIPPAIDGRRKRKRQYSLQEDALDKAEERPEAAYFMGLLITDGSIKFDRKTKAEALEFTQTGVRCDTVYKFKEFLKTDKPIYKRKAPGCRGLTYVIAITCDHLIRTVKSYGVVNNKTSQQRADSRLLWNRNFWRGVFDGDGSVKPLGKTSLELSFKTTSPVLFQQWVDYITPIVGKEGYSYSKLTFSGSGKVQQATIFTGEEAFILASHLYDDSIHHSEAKYEPYRKQKIARLKKAEG